MILKYKPSFQQFGAGLLSVSAWERDVPMLYLPLTVSCDGNG